MAGSLHRRHHHHHTVVSWSFLRSSILPSLQPIPPPQITSPSSLPPRLLLHAPLCQGLGQTFAIDGALVGSVPWFDLACQSTLPSLQLHAWPLRKAPAIVEDGEAFGAGVLTHGPVFTARAVAPSDDHGAALAAGAVRCSLSLSAAFNGGSCLEVCRLATAPSGHPEAAAPGYPVDCVVPLFAADVDLGVHGACVVAHGHGVLVTRWFGCELR